MLRSIQRKLVSVVGERRSLGAIILICVGIPFVVIMRLMIRKAKKEGERRSSSGKKKRKKFKSCYDSATLLGLETDMTTNSAPNENGPIRETLGDALGLTAHEAGPNSGMTIGEVLGPMRGGEKRSRKWMITLIRAVARMSCRDPTEAPAAEERKVRMKKRGRREKRGRDDGLGLCHVCGQRSKNSTLVPCGHAYCRVCSREIWINAHYCPICSAHILEVLDTF